MCLKVGGVVRMQPRRRVDVWVTTCVTPTEESALTTSTLSHPHLQPSLSRQMGQGVAII